MKNFCLCSPIPQSDHQWTVSSCVACCLQSAKERHKLHILIIEIGLWGCMIAMHIKRRNLLMLGNIGYWTLLFAHIMASPHLVITTTRRWYGAVYDVLQSFESIEDWHWESEWIEVGAFSKKLSVFRIVYGLYYMLILSQHQSKDGASFVIFAILSENVIFSESSFIVPFY